MNAPTSVSTLLRDLIDTLSLFGPNKAQHPFDMAYHHREWWITIELDAPHATLDVEAHAIDLSDALQNALRRIRREASIKHLVAA